MTSQPIGVQPTYKTKPSATAVAFFGRPRFLGGSAGGVSISEKEIAVGGVPLPSFTVTPNPVPTNTPVTFDASASTAAEMITRYQWDFFGDGSFDYVVMSGALQAMQRPDRVVAEILRVGRTGIVTFPNFGHWRVRLALALGRMPATPALPDTWYGTANIHLCTVADFEDLCGERGWRIARRALMNHRHVDGAAARLLPNLLAEVALYQLESPRG